MTCKTPNNPAEASGCAPDDAQRCGCGCRCDTACPCLRGGPCGCGCIPRAR